MAVRITAAFLPPATRGLSTKFAMPACAGRGENGTEVDRNLRIALNDCRDRLQEDGPEQDWAQLVV
jgi:hypothetical protein